MNLERARALYKKMLPFALAAFGLGIGGTAIARGLTADDCCKPGAACCHPGAPCCDHAAKDHAANGHDARQP